MKTAQLPVGCPSFPPGMLPNRAQPRGVCEPAGSTRPQRKSLLFLITTRRFGREIPTRHLLALADRDGDVPTGWHSPGWRVELLVRDAPRLSQTLKVAREGQDHAPADGAAERTRPRARAPGLLRFTLGILWRGLGAESRDGAPGPGAASARQRAGRGASPRGREEGPLRIGKNLCFSASTGSVTTFTSDVAGRRGSGRNRAPRPAQVWGTSAGVRARDKVQVASTRGSQSPGLDQGRCAY